MSTPLETARKAVSVVVRARNAVADLRQLLARLSAQEVPPDSFLQVIVVDNESSDGTGQMAREWGAEVVDLSRAEFTWGRALNKGIAAAKGELVVLLSADAWPTGDCWVTDICAPFSDARVAVVFARQIPHATASLDEWVRIRATFPHEPRHWSAADLVGDRIPGLVASNSCAVLRRSVWETYPYDEASHGAEEHPWTAQVLHAGYRAVYLPDVFVEHSHNDPPLRQALRLWELELEKRRLAKKRIRKRDALRITARFAKQRMVNMGVLGVGHKRRGLALLALPIETAAMAGVALAILAGVRFHNLRQKWWS